MSEKNGNEGTEAAGSAVASAAPEEAGGLSVTVEMQGADGKTLRRGFNVAGKVEAGEAAGVPWPKLKKISALFVERVEPGWVGRMAERSVPVDLNGIAAEVRTAAGWCGRNALEAFEAGADGGVNAGLVYFVRTPPASLVAATVEREIAQYHREHGFKAGKATRKEIKARVIDALTAGAQWKPSSNRVLARADLAPGGMVFTDAVSDSAVMAVRGELCAAGIRAAPVTPDMLFAMNGCDAAWLEPQRWFPRRSVHLGVEFLTWCAWRVLAAEGDEAPFGVDTPFVTVAKGSREEIKGADDGAPVAEMLRKSLAAGRQLRKLRLYGGGVRLTADAELRLPAAAFQYDEPEGAYEAARLAWRGLELVFGRYMEVRTDAAAWKAAEAGLSAWLERK